MGIYAHYLFLTKKQLLHHAGFLPKKFIFLINTLEPILFPPESSSNFQFFDAVNPLASEEKTTSVAGPGGKRPLPKRIKKQT